MRAGQRQLLLLGVPALLILLCAPYQRHPLLLVLIGGAIGLTLALTRFGFSRAYRDLLLRRDTTGVQGQLLLLAIASAAFAPLLDRGEFAGLALYGALAPAGLQVALGALLFGVGMQLAGGCGSGTLAASGSGSLRGAVALTAFCAGAWQGSLDLGWWQQLPTLETLSLYTRFGWWPALAGQLLLLVLLWLVLRCGVQREPRSRSYWAWRQLLQHPQGWFTGALLLALLNIATLLTVGHPWTITWAFSLWGAKAASLAGWMPASSPFWSAPFQADALAAPLWADSTSVMNLAIMAGVALATPHRHGTTPWQPKALLASAIGGLLLGYGARLAYGCNVGAFFSGIASGSLHGWLWILCALPGNWLGIQLRPRFALSNH